MALTSGVHVCHRVLLLTGWLTQPALDLGRGERYAKVTMGVFFLHSVCSSTHIPGRGIEVEVGPSKHFIHDIIDREFSYQCLLLVPTLRKVYREYAPSKCNGKSPECLSSRGT